MTHIYHLLAQQRIKLWGQNFRNYIGTCLYLGNNRSKKEKWLWSHKNETYPIQNMIIIISRDVQMPILSSLLLLSNKTKLFLSPAVSAIECEIHEGSRSCLFDIAHAAPHTVPGTSETLNKYLCNKRGKKKSQWSGDWDEREEWGTNNRTNKSEIMLVKSHSWCRIRRNLSRILTLLI